jgi:hypothetical protein
VSAPLTSSERIAHSRLLVDSLLNAARAHAARRNDHIAALLVSVAATVSRRRHTGLFANLEIEELLLALSASIPAVTHAEAAAGSPESAHGSALHVMTSCNTHGGHTRLVSTWVSMRPETRSSLVLTSPASPMPPPELVEAIRCSGGEIHHLEGDTFHRASALRALAWSTDVVILEAHENDVVPSLALASATGRPPVVLINHAEHVFWVGASIADVVVSLRPAAGDLAVRRRGIGPDRSLEVALPLRAVTRAMPIDDAKRALGIGSNEKLLVTVGWAYKYAPVAGDDLIGLLETILARPDVRLLAVGPTDAHEPWASAKARYGDEVRALGPRDARTVLEAADIYLESFPIGSLTASLEAGMLGVPVVGLSRDRESWPPILREDDPAIADHVFTDPPAYLARITSLLDDPDARTEDGRALQARVEQLHGVATWSSGVAGVLDTARKLARVPTKKRWEAVVGQPGLEDEILAGVIADNEDRVHRSEMHFAREPDLPGTDALELINARMEQLDALILAGVSPGRREYAAAVRIARSVTPRRLRLSVAVSRVSGKRNAGG